MDDDWGYPKNDFQKPLHMCILSIHGGTPNSSNFFFLRNFPMKNFATIQRFLGQPRRAGHLHGSHPPCLQSAVHHSVSGFTTAAAIREGHRKALQVAVRPQPLAREGQVRPGPSGTKMTKNCGFLPCFIGKANPFSLVQSQLWSQENFSKL